MILSLSGPNLPEVQDDDRWLAAAAILTRDEITVYRYLCQEVFHQSDLDIAVMSRDTKISRNKILTTILPSLERHGFVFVSD